MCKRLGTIAPCAVLAMLAWSAIAAAAGDNAWIELRTPHFRILSDGVEAEARAAALQFEQMRATFAAVLPSLRLTPAAPLLILAVRDDASEKRLLPEMWKRSRIKPAGFFADGQEKAFAIIRLDVVQRQAASQPGGNGYQVVYHEYTHSILNANFRWLPLWLNEGLAEFFGNTQFQGDDIYLGAPNVRAEYTRGRRLLALDALLQVNAASPEYRDPDKVQLFYSESWGLVHLLLGPRSPDKGRRLQDYLKRIDEGTDSLPAFRQAIGSIPEIQDQLKHDLDADPDDAFVFKNPSRLSERDVAVRPLSPAQANAELGTVQVWLHENDAARRSLGQALQSASAPALAAESMGFLSFNEGDDKQALANFQRALQQDARLYLSAYYAAMLSPDSAEPGRSAAFRSAMGRVLELNSEFAPAYVQLAASYVREGNYERAAAAAVKAAQLRPSWGGCHILVGEILHALGRDAEAAAVARFVADRWQDIEHDRALELWRRLPAEARRGATFAERSAPSGARVIRGALESVECRGRGETMSMVIDGSPLTLVVKNENVKLGLDNTVWYAADHFNRCRRLDGLQAVIQYRPAARAGAAGELVSLEAAADLAGADK